MNEITPRELAALGGTPVLIDVRQPEEWANARVAGATLIPLGELMARLGEIPTEGTVHIMCHAGGRSAQATVYLEAQGVDAVNVAGGITEWIASGLPVERGA